MNINWQSYDDGFFQLFCNALLSLEVSKTVTPYKAPGKDGGIDGWFAGSYGDKTGKWRFQNKFHKTARRESVSSLKVDISKEVPKTGDEDHLIIITNVSLLPKERKELLALGEQQLQSISKANVTFDIWDDAKIHTLYILHPILKLWMEEGFTTAQVIPYKEYFGKRLQVGIEDPSTLANEFIARESCLTSLKEFMYNSEKSFAIVSGEAGIGKTRLIIEFFRNEVDTNDAWLALVLNTHRITIDKLSFALSGDKNILLLVDDAHGYSPEVIADLKNLLRIPVRRQLKFILTGRRLSIRNALESISAVESNSMCQIDVPKLTKDETRELFKRQTNIGHYRNYIPQLVNTSNGRPILIVALLRAIRANTPIPSIKEKEFLKNYVRDYFRNVIKITSAHSGISQLKLEDLTKVICLLEPLPLSNEVFYDKLSKFKGIDVSVIQYFKEMLLAEGLAQKRYEFVLSPDYYSDIMLATANQELVISSLSTFPELVSNIIVNLSAVDEAYDKEDQGWLGLDAILKIYVPSISTVNPIDIKEILNTVTSIAYQKPEFGKQSITLFIERLKGPDGSTLQRILNSDIQNRSIGRKSLYGAISMILHDLLYRSENETFVFDQILAINQITPDLGLFKNTFGLDKRHVINGYNFKQQYSFLDEALKLLPSNHVDSSFFIDAAKDFLRLEFTVSALDPFNSNQINLMHFDLPADEEVVKLRRKVIDSLIRIYQSDHSDDIRKRVIHELMDIPRAISASSRSNKPYQGDEEVLFILDFIATIAGTMPLAANREVIDRLYWMKKWDKHEVVNAKIAEIKKQLEPKTLTEKILSLLNKTQTRLNLSYEKLITDIEDKAKELMRQHEADQIALSLAEVRKVQAGYLEFFWPINKALHDNFPDKAMLVYDKLWQIDREYLYQYGSGFLYAFRFKHNLLEFYRAKISELESLGQPESISAILFVYSRLSESVNNSDVELIDRVFNNHRGEPKISLNLLMALMTLQNAGYERAEQMKDLFDNCPQRVAENFFMFNRGMDPALLKDLILNHSTQFDLSFELQNAITLLLEKKTISVEELFQYFLRRFKIKQDQILNKDYSWYEYIPHENFNVTSSFDEKEKIEFFLRGLRWFATSPFEGMVEYSAKKLIDFLQPSEEMTPALVNAYQQEADQTTDPNHFRRFVSSINVFKTKNKILLDLVMALFQKGRKLPGMDIDELQEAVYLAITIVGVKSGTSGQPFPVDVQLRQLIVDWLAESLRDTYEIDFLNKVIKSLDKEIERTSDKNESIW